MAGVGKGSYKQIILEKLIHSKSENGNWNSEPEKVRYPIWALVTNSDGQRVNRNGQQQIVDGKTFKIYFNPGINPNVDWKIIYSGKSHTITSIRMDREKRFHWLINATSVDDK